MEKMETKRTSFLARAAMTLLVMFFTTSTSWAVGAFSGGDGTSGSLRRYWQRPLPGVRRDGRADFRQLTHIAKLFSRVRT